jgi:hypothetical protein
VVRALVIYESFFGCTWSLAEAVASSLGDHDDATADAVHVHAAPGDLTGVDLLVVGAPTHMFGLSSGVSRWLQAQYWGAPSGTRRDRRPYGRPTESASMRRWLGEVQWRGPGPRAAAFDTRVGGRSAGGAAATIAVRLSRRGVLLIGAPEAFRVRSVTGPLAPGELARASTWGSELARRMDVPATG